MVSLQIQPLSAVRKAKEIEILKFDESKTTIERYPITAYSAASSPSLNVHLVVVHSSLCSLTSESTYFLEIGAHEKSSILRYRVDPSVAPDHYQNEEPSQAEFDSDNNIDRTVAWLTDQFRFCFITYCASSDSPEINARGLAVLTSPTMVTILPVSNFPPNTPEILLEEILEVPLPFEAVRIYSFDDNSNNLSHGIFIQRSMPPPPLASDFIEPPPTPPQLQLPPKKIRQRLEFMEDGVDTAEEDDIFLGELDKENLIGVNIEEEEFPSLFEMNHPLEELLPVAIGNSETQQYISDPEESLILLAYGSNGMYGVTWNEGLRRHCVWRVEGGRNSLNPPQQQEEQDVVVDSDIPETNSKFYDTAPLPDDPPIINRTASPTITPTFADSLTGYGRTTSPVNFDAPQHSSQLPQPQPPQPPQVSHVNNGPYGSLSPQSIFTPIYTQPSHNVHNSKSTSAFVITGYGTSTTSSNVLVLHCAVTGKLTLITVNDDDTTKEYAHAEHIISAIPLNPLSKSVTDLLIFTSSSPSSPSQSSSSQQSSPAILTLCNFFTHSQQLAKVCDCRLSHNAPLSHLSLPVHNTFRTYYNDGTFQKNTFSLRLCSEGCKTDDLSENILDTIESVLIRHSGESSVTPYSFRVQTHQLHTKLTSWFSALSAVLKSYFFLTMNGAQTNATNPLVTMMEEMNLQSTASQTHTSTTNSGSSNFDQLLSSSYHKSFTSDSWNASIQDILLPPSSVSNSVPHLSNSITTTRTTRSNSNSKKRLREQSSSPVPDQKIRQLFTTDELNALKTGSYDSSRTPKNPSLLPRIFDSLHVFHEDCKVRLDRHMFLGGRFDNFGSSGGNLSGLLLGIVKNYLHHNSDNAADFVDIIDHYSVEMDLPDGTVAPPPVVSSSNKSGQNRSDLTGFSIYGRNDSPAPPLPDITKFLVKKVGGVTDDTADYYRKPTDPPPPEATRLITSIWSTLFRSSNDRGNSNTIDHESLVDLILFIAQNFECTSSNFNDWFSCSMTTTNGALGNFPLGITLPIFESLRYARKLVGNSDEKDGESFNSVLKKRVGSNNQQLLATCYELIGRSDLSRMMKKSSGASVYVSAEERFYASQSQLNVDASSSSTSGAITTTSANSNDSSVSISANSKNAKSAPPLAVEGLTILPKLSSMIYPSDGRIHTVVKLLSSSSPYFLNVARPPEVSDHDHEHMKQHRLSLLIQRGLASIIGRGMATLNTLPMGKGGSSGSSMSSFTSGDSSAGNNPGDTLDLGGGSGDFASAEVMNNPETVKIPPLSKIGVVPPTFAQVTLNTTNPTPPPNEGANFDALIFEAFNSVWCQFHNGVSATLKLDVGGGFGDGKNFNVINSNKKTPEVTRTWIMFNSPDGGGNNGGDGDGAEADNGEEDASSAMTPHSHGGFLFALGLKGLLHPLSMVDVHDLLTKGVTTTTVGVLLGMGVCYGANDINGNDGFANSGRGSADPSVSKMLCLHIPPLLPPPFSHSILIPPAVQSAAVVGVGFLYNRTSHRLMSEFLLGEIGSTALPIHQEGSNGGGGGSGNGNTGTNEEASMAHHRDSYILSVGFALGMVNLGKGDGGGVLGDLRLAERLGAYIHGEGGGHFGGNYQNYNYMPAQKSVDGSVMHDGSLDESMKTPNSPSFGTYNHSHNHPPGLGGGGSVNDSINVTVTSPAGVLALCLTYLRTNDSHIANILAPPTTFFALDLVRPDSLMLRVVGRGLIMWDDVKGDEEWVLKQIPAVVRSGWEALGGQGGEAGGLGGGINLEDLMARVGEEEETEKEVSTDGATTQKADDKGGGKAKKNDSKKKEVKIPLHELDTIRDSYIHLLAGALLLLGIRFAGTQNPKVKKVVLKHLSMLKKLRDSKGNRLDNLYSRRPRNLDALEMCMNCVASSLGMVMAGSGDLTSLKMLKSLRSNLTNPHSRFGSQMAIASAIGLLFLPPTGRRGVNSPKVASTLSTKSDLQIASLLISFYPRYPSHASDNLYHLQPLRHLYVLAVVPRGVDSFDVDTGSPVFLPIEIEVDCKEIVKRRDGGDNTGDNDNDNDTGRYGRKKWVRLTSPCLLPPVYHRIRIPPNSRYHPMVIPPPSPSGSPSFERPLTIFAKIKRGNLPYVDDPSGSKSLAIRGTDKSKLGDAINDVTRDRRVEMFAREFCDASATTGEDEVSGGRGVKSFAGEVIMRCLGEDKLEAVGHYFGLRGKGEVLLGLCPPKVYGSVGWSRRGASEAEKNRAGGDCKLIWLFCERRRGERGGAAYGGEDEGHYGGEDEDEDEGQDSLLDGGFVDELRERVELALERSKEEGWEGGGKGFEKIWRMSV